MSSLPPVFEMRAQQLLRTRRSRFVGWTAVVVMTIFLCLLDSSLTAANTDNSPRTYAAAGGEGLRTRFANAALSPPRVRHEGQRAILGEAVPPELQRKVAALAPQAFIAMLNDGSSLSASASSPTKVPSSDEPLAASSAAPTSTAKTSSASLSQSASASASVPTAPSSVTATSASASASASAELPDPSSSAASHSVLTPSIASASGTHLPSASAGPSSSSSASTTPPPTASSDSATASSGNAHSSSASAGPSSSSSASISTTTTTTVAPQSSVSASASSSDSSSGSTSSTAAPSASSSHPASHSSSSSGGGGAATSSTSTSTAPTSSTTTTTTTTTTKPSSATASGAGSKWWISLVVVLPIVAVAAVLAVVWCCWNGKLCFIARASRLAAKNAAVEGGGNARGAEMQPRAAKDGLGGKLASSAGAPRYTNPLSLSSPSDSTRAAPLVAGDPAHVNRHNNRPYQVNGIVPWTGLPPVLRGPQPTCVVPTIERNGKVIPREERVSPGLGLYETPKVYIDAPPPSKADATAATKAKSCLSARVRRRPKKDAAVAPASTAATDPPQRLQWFHQLIHFTPLDTSPVLSATDESGSDDDAGETAVPAMTAPSGAQFDVAPARAAPTSAGAAAHPCPPPPACPPPVAVPMEVRRYGEGVSAGCASGSGLRAPRPNGSSGMVLRHPLPPPAPTSRLPSLEEAFAFQGGAVPDAAFPQQQLSAQALSLSSAREPAFLSSRDSPVSPSYSWGAGDSFGDVVDTMPAR